MSTAERPAVTRAIRGSPPLGVGYDLAVAFLPLLGASLTTWWALALPASYLLVAVVLYGLACALILRSPPPLGALAARGLGPANRVTLARALLVLPVAALVPHHGALDDPALIWIIVVCSVAMVLDGVDGRLARKTGTESRFGARFDMELDAFLLLVLSLLVWLEGSVGTWVVLIGALRYLFVIAGWMWHRLREDLPASRRRRVICAVQGVALLVCLAPVGPPGVAPAVAAAALAALVFSFGVDLRWLVLRGGEEAVGS